MTIELTDKLGKAYTTLKWIGIIDQLMSSRVSRTLASSADITMPQFVILLHMIGRPQEEHTVTRLAYSFQLPQPGVTKNVNALLQKDYLTSAPHETDGRVKILTIAPGGEKAFAAALEQFVPDLDALFSDWTIAEIDRLFIDLDRLKTWLDTKGRG